MDVPSGVAQGGAETALPANRPSRARCPDCGVIESARGVAKRNKASGTEPCANRVTADSYDSAENADLAILLDWHMNARNGYSFIRREIGCSTLAALAAPLLIEPSKAFEILVRFRDGPSQILTEANLSAWRQRERGKEGNESD
jgi:hypothetical protein